MNEYCENNKIFLNFFFQARLEKKNSLSGMKFYIKGRVGNAA